MTPALDVRQKSGITTAHFALLLLAHIAVCCLSLTYVIRLYDYTGLFMLDRAQLGAALLTTAAIVPIAMLFVVSRFSFGYFVGFGFFTIILGYLWLARFSRLDYDHTLGAVSALAALLAFLTPALFVTSPIRQRVPLSSAALDKILMGIMVLSAVVIATGAAYNFNLVGLENMYKVRVTLEFPRPLLYAIGICSNALLPYAFACFFMRNNRWRALAALLLLLLFYPITLTKVALFAPLWLLLLALLARYFEARIVAVLCLFLTISAGLLLEILPATGVISQINITPYFLGPINFRMIAVPSIAIDMYADFFSKHGVTHFCQILFLKAFVGCPYNEPLSVIMSSNYPLGFANASLFATEGIASLGLKWAPLSTLACGSVVAVVNRISGELPPKFILLSAGTLWQVLMNVPFTTTLLTNGAALLFVLWYVTPRAIFGQK